MSRLIFRNLPTAIISKATQRCKKVFPTLLERLSSSINRMRTDGGNRNIKSGTSTTRNDPQLANFYPRAKRPNCSLSLSSQRRSLKNKVFRQKITRLKSSLSPRLNKRLGRNLRLKTLLLVSNGRNASLRLV